MLIHINKDGQQYGPYTIDQVNEYLAQGSLQTTDPAWHDGMAEWCPLSQIAGVVDPNSPTPPSFDPTTSGVQRDGKGHFSHIKTPKQKVGAVCCLGSLYILLTVNFWLGLALGFLGAVLIGNWWGRK